MSLLPFLQQSSCDSEKPYSIMDITHNAFYKALHMMKTICIISHLP